MWFHCNSTSDGVVKFLICFVVKIIISFQRTLVRRKDIIVLRFSYDVFYLATINYIFLRVHQPLTLPCFLRDSLTSDSIIA